MVPNFRADHPMPMAPLSCLQQKINACHFASIRKTGRQPKRKSVAASVCFHKMSALGMGCHSKNIYRFISTQAKGGGG